jgi:hypothetical protein
MVNLSYPLPNGNQANQTTGAVVPYPEEFRRLDPDDFLLTRVAEISGGQTLTYEDVSNTYRLARSRVRAPVPIWPALVLIGMLTFVADIAVRRLAFDRRQWDLAREKLAEFRARIRRADQPQVEVDPTLGRLLVRKRATTRRGPAAAPGAPESAPVEAAAPVATPGGEAARAGRDDPAERERLREQLAAAMERRTGEPAAGGPAPSPAPAETGDTFSRLMSAKKRVQR